MTRRRRARLQRSVIEVHLHANCTSSVLRSRLGTLVLSAIELNLLWLTNRILLAYFKWTCELYGSLNKVLFKYTWESACRKWSVIGVDLPNCTSSVLRAHLARWFEVQFNWTSGEIPNKILQVYFQHTFELYGSANKVLFKCTWRSTKSWLHFKCTWNCLEISVRKY